MSKVCKSCGTVLADDVFFCTECGAPCPPENVMPKESGEEAAKPAEAPASFDSTVTYGTPAPVPAPAPAPKTEEPKPKKGQYTIPENLSFLKPVSTAGFFWLAVVFAMPFVGFVLSIILSCAAKKINLKHYAKAVLIAKIIAIVFSILTTVGLYFLMVSLKTQLGGMGVEIHSFQDFLEVIKTLGLEALQ